MATGIKYVFDKPGFAQLVNGPGVSVYIKELAEVGAQYAYSIAPEGKTGNYRDSIESSTGHEYLFSALRPVGYVSDNVDYGAVVEIHHHVLARTADFLEAGG